MLTSVSSLLSLFPFRRRKVVNHNRDSTSSQDMPTRYPAVLVELVAFQFYYSGMRALAKSRVILVLHNYPKYGDFVVYDYHTNVAKKDICFRQVDEPVESFGRIRIREILIHERLKPTQMNYLDEAHIHLKNSLAEGTFTSLINDPGPHGEEYRWRMFSYQIQYTCHSLQRNLLYWIFPNTRVLEWNEYIGNIRRKLKDAYLPIYLEYYILNKNRNQWTIAYDIERSQLH